MTQHEVREKIDSRDAAHRLLARLTTGTVLGALAGVGVFGYVSAATIPGKTSDATTSASATTSATTSSTDASSSQNDDSSSSSGLSTSSGSVSSSSGSSTPIAVTGGSR